MMGLGAGLTTGGLIGVAAGARGQQCYGADSRESNSGWAVTGAALTTVGVILSAGGLVRLMHSDRGLSSRRAWVAPVAVLAAAVATGLWLAAGANSWVGCVSS